MTEWLSLTTPSSRLRRCLAVTVVGNIPGFFLQHLLHCFLFHVTKRMSVAVMFAITCFFMLNFIKAKQHCTLTFRMPSATPTATSRQTIFPRITISPGPPRTKVEGKTVAFTPWDHVDVSFRDTFGVLSDFVLQSKFIYYTKKWLGYYSVSWCLCQISNWCTPCFAVKQTPSFHLAARQLQMKSAAAMKTASSIGNQILNWFAMYSVGDVLLSWWRTNWFAIYSFNNIATFHVHALKNIMYIVHSGASIKQEPLEEPPRVEVMKLNESVRPCGASIKQEPLEEPPVVEVMKLNESVRPCCVAVEKLDAQCIHRFTCTKGTCKCIRPCKVSIPTSAYMWSLRRANGLAIVGLSLRESVVIKTRHS